MKAITTLLLSIFVSIQFAYSQSNVENDPLFKEIVQLKEQMTKNYKLKEFYVIQLHSGNKDKAQKIKEDIDFFISQNRQPDSFQKEAIIVYETPNYKVWIGRFNTRLLADRFFLKIKEDYPNALILKPGLG
jgi:hypothetical protein